MNVTMHGTGMLRLMERAKFLARRFGSAKTLSFAAPSSSSVVGRVYVINLDRRPDRWRRMSRELSRMRVVDGNALAAMTRRFSAVDARYLEDPSIAGVIDPQYSLAQQLFVQPNPLLVNRIRSHARLIAMTRQEMAVALSHIDVWKRIATGHGGYTLVLEDDAYFVQGFARAMDRAWSEVLGRREAGRDIDLLYLSYKEAEEVGPRQAVSAELFEPVTGLWQLSGYVLSRNGAQRLLDLLPVRGPVDLWINHQFSALEVVASRRPIIRQRADSPSANSYSVLPVLSEVGALTGENPLLVRANGLPAPVFAYGENGAGATALAMALSMLGYRCCSDLSELPPTEQARLVQGKRDRIFDAYVNVGSVSPDTWPELAGRYRRARFIVASERDGPRAEDASGEMDADQRAGLQPSWAPFLHRVAELRSGSLLELPVGHPDRWQVLCGFLGGEYPVHAYPDSVDQPQRTLLSEAEGRHGAVPIATRMKADRSPWVVPHRYWDGIALERPERAHRRPCKVVDYAPARENFDGGDWWLRDDTFPGNLSLFSPQNVSLVGGSTVLTLTEEACDVRDYTSGSIASRSLYAYGRFTAELMPAAVPGLVTGMFLHRNAPRQEIDIEFLGKDTTKMLVNVFYNPGQAGDKLEYGYRGTPALVDLGFDASEAFHTYEIEWWPDVVSWRVDGRLLHQRVTWDPTPIPHMPLEFNVNLWNSRSRELAGKLAVDLLPARTLVNKLLIESATSIVVPGRHVHT